jgi:hypothetical protein
MGDAGPVNGSDIICSLKAVLCSETSPSILWARFTGASDLERGSSLPPKLWSEIDWGL